MSVFGAVRERTYELMEPGEYAFTLSDLEFSADGPYGDSLKWIWLIAPTDDATSYFCNSNGNEKTLHQYTDADLVIGSRQLEWVTALAGRAFKEGDEPPDEDDLLGKRMVAYLGHYTPKKGKNAGTTREKIFEGSAKRFTLPAPRAAAPAAAPESDADERILLVAAIKKEVRKATMLEVEAAEQWAAIDFDDLSTDELRSGLETIREAVAQA